jgi:hypothetical protein
MNKHGLHTVPVIGITCWVGNEGLPNYAIDVLNINSAVFDTIYLVVSKESKEKIQLDKLTDKIRTIEVESTNIDITLPDLTPTQFSDYLSYYAIQFLKSHHIAVDKVIYFDVDFIIYNKLLITRLFDGYNETFFSVEESGYPWSTGDTKYFINSSFSFLVKDTYLSEALLPNMIESIRKNPNKYTASGPAMLNSLGIKNKLPGDCFITTARPSNRKYKKNYFELGLHLEISTLLYEFPGYDLAVDIEGDDIILKDYNHG